MAKLKLDLEPDPGVIIIGISCHENDYRLCWSINRALDLQLTRRRHNIQDEVNNIRAQYAVFDHLDQNNEVSYTLVNNHSADGILLKDQRQADFFLVVDDRVAGDLADLLERIRAADFVLTAFNLPYDQLKAGHKLLL